jgi:hypothetical protein
MTLLNILHSGGAFWGLTAVFVVLEAIFLFQLIKGQKSGSVQQDLAKGTQTYKKPIPLFKNPFIWLMIIVLVAYIFTLSQLSSDYKGV